MDLPKANYYGVQCHLCEKVFYYNSQKKAELLLSISFIDWKKIILIGTRDIELREKLPDFLKTNIGLVIGFVHPKTIYHVCKS